MKEPGDPSKALELGRHGQSSDDPPLFFLAEVARSNKRAGEVERFLSDADEQTLGGLPGDAERIQAETEAKRARAAALREQASLAQELSIAVSQGERIEDARAYVTARVEERAGILQEAAAAVRQVEHETDGNPEEVGEYIAWKDIVDNTQVLVDQAGGSLAQTQKRREALPAIRAAMYETTHGKRVAVQEKAQEELAYVQRVMQKLSQG
jgi:hypothetical protein